MTELKTVKSSSGEEITNEKGSTKFKCPNCSKYTIVRSLHERKIATKYTCPECDFSGPN
ncbi:MAG: zinc finger domain-containing protein [Candidatus Nanoarchaeia archaeon]|jgi:predicted RNA-binding Zn-ribbon protein involved in translation (DUF1610 family)|nr:zinc finger domain-containing protein [Candidatus Nanoarchaeia archaeon]|tara:strand:+ start:14591 stop:14767 length:177 start_codon:yes stop_codon:yes gene_type:complete